MKQQQQPVRFHSFAFKASGGAHGLAARRRILEQAQVRLNDLADQVEALSRQLEGVPCQICRRHTLSLLTRRMRKVAEKIAEKKTS